MQVVMIRHLPTAWNLNGVLQGSQDISIAAVGPKVKKDIENNLEKLNKEYGAFDKIFVSRLVRTKQTAEVYGFNDVIEESLLNELNFGDFEGRKKSELVATYQDKWFDDPESIVLGEPMTALKTRVLNFFKKYQDTKKVLIFGHGNWIRSAMSLSQCQTLEKLNQIHLANNQLIQLTWKQKG